MPRADLTRLLGNVGETSPSEVTPHEVEVVAERAQEASSRTTQQEPAQALPKQVKRAAPVVKPAPEVEPGAAYLRFVRKETRLRDDQQNALTTHARRLSRARSKSAPRITDNTLIRVAVDLLLEWIESASGDDEAAILKSPKH
ncbi:hypothetical protein BH11ACT2_BH11ACT2_20360 [soil metagenome]